MFIVQRVVIDETESEKLKQRGTRQYLYDVVFGEESSQVKYTTILGHKHFVLKLIVCIGKSLRGDDETLGSRLVKRL